MSASRTYELVYIISPEATEQEVADLHTQVESIIQKFSGRIERTETWGRKRLAYEIARQKEGIYVLEVMQGPGEMIKELDRRLKVIDRVLRHLVVRIDEAMQVAERRHAERQAERARRREARGLPPEPEGDADAGRAADAASGGLDQGDEQGAEA
jgi:small subunit ribosomal protein S6